MRIALSSGVKCLLLGRSLAACAVSEPSLETITRDNVDRLVPLVSAVSATTPTGDARWIDDTHVVIDLYERDARQPVPYEHDLISLAVTRTLPLASLKDATGEVQFHHPAPGLSVALELRRVSGELIVYEGPPWRVRSRQDVGLVPEGASFVSGVLADGTAWGALTQVPSSWLVVGTNPPRSLPGCHWIDVALDGRFIACSLLLEVVGDGASIVLQVLDADHQAVNSTVFDFPVFAPFFSRNGQYIVVDASGAAGIGLQFVPVMQKPTRELEGASSYWIESSDGSVLFSSLKTGRMGPSFVTSWEMGDDFEGISVLAIDGLAFAPWVSPDGKRLLTSSLELDSGGDWVTLYTVYGVPSPSMEK